MSEYIEREKLGIGRCNPKVFEDKGYAKGWNAAIDIIQSAPTADVRPVVRGKWMWFGDCSNEGLYCSVCHNKIHEVKKPKKKLSNFCPNCGADMREEHDD